MQQILTSARKTISANWPSNQDGVNSSTINKIDIHVVIHSMKLLFNSINFRPAEIFANFSLVL